MSLQTDIIFVKALQSNAGLMEQLPDGDVHNTAIALPDVDLDNAQVPYVIVEFLSLSNEDTTKDGYEGDTDRVQIGIEVAARTRAELCQLTMEIRRTIREYFENIDTGDEDANLVPLDYQFTAQGVVYDADKPCYWQVLNYQCDTNIDE